MSASAMQEKTSTASTDSGLTSFAKYTLAGASGGAVVESGAATTVYNAVVSGGSWLYSTGAPTAYSATVSGLCTAWTWFGGVSSAIGASWAGTAWAWAANGLMSAGIANTAVVADVMLLGGVGTLTAAVVGGIGYGACKLYKKNKTNNKK